MELTNQPSISLESAPPDVFETLPESESVAVPVAQTAPRIAISLELALYAALILLSLTLRLAELGTYPLNDLQAHDALAVFRAIEPRAAGVPLIANNPLMFTANSLVMAFAGSDTATPKIPTVLLGVLLVAAPVLFRRWL